MKKPTSVQFKFFEDLQMLTDPTEPRISTVEIPAQEQIKLSKHVKRYYIPSSVPLVMFAIALAVCGCLFLATLYPHF